MAWISVNDKMPPPHEPLVFLDDMGKLWQGDMCYGMHAPWYCVHSPDRKTTFVLSDSGLRI